MNESSNIHTIILYAKGPSYHKLIRFALSEWLRIDSKAQLIYDCIEIISKACDDYCEKVLQHSNARFLFGHEFILEAAKMLAIYMQAGMFDHLLKRRGAA